MNESKYVPTYRPHETADRCNFAGYSDELAALKLNENNYCTVNATAAALNILWSEAHSLLKRCGRKPRRGIVSRILMEGSKISKYGDVREAKWFYSGRSSWKAGITIKTFLKLADPSKRYYVTVTRHALAVIGGKVRGESNLNRRIKFIWEVTPKIDRAGAINLPVLVDKRPVVCDIES